MSVEIRPMTHADVDGVAKVVMAANDAADAKAGRPPEAVTDEEMERFRAGTRRFVDVDPGGAWVAEEAQGIVGMAEAIRRGTFWGLSMLFVHPRTQSQGVGRRLLDKTLAYAEGSDVQMIMTSEDPRALRRYSRAGLAIHPAVEATGPLDRSRIPADIPGRDGSVDDLDLVAAVDATFGRDRTSDVAALLAHGGGRLHVVSDGDRRGYGVQREARMTMIGATDDQTAAAVLWRMLAAVEPDAKVQIWCLTAQQDWAVRVALEGALVVRGAGPLFVGGLDLPPRPWIPSGWYF